MTNFEAIESLLKTGEKDNVDLAVAIMEGMPEVYRAHRAKWEFLNKFCSIPYKEKDKSWTGLFRRDDFEFNALNDWNYRTPFGGVHRAFELLFELTHLQSINFMYCTILDKEPLIGGIGDMPNLVKINVSGTKILRLPEGMGRLKKLELLGISDTAIYDLPKTMRNTQIDVLYANRTKIPHPVDFFAEWENVGKMYYTNHEGKTAELSR